MGKVQEFQIAFDKNKVIYSPGDSITGTVTVTATGTLTCKAIKVNCNGFCGVTSKVNDTSWMAEEQYFNSTISVADKGTIKQGQHAFPFKFLIPATAPTSFEGSYGRIVYRVRAFIDTPRFAKDYNTEKPFFLLRIFNLNEVPDIWGTSDSAITKQFTYMLVKTGTVALKAQIDMKGYTPGQIIQVMANVHNQSGKTTGNISGSLIQKVTYDTKRPTLDVRTIAEVEGGAVKAGKEVEWKEQIIVPPLPQSSLAGCELIKIEYYVKICLKSPEVMLTLPVHIGNVALDKKLQPPKEVDAALSTPAEDTPEPVQALNASAANPTLPPRPAPKPAPRPAPRARTSFGSSPSAPPAELLEGAAGGGHETDSFSNKRQSQLVSPNAFSYAPGLFFPQGQQQGGAEGCSPAPTAPYPTGNPTCPMPTPLILPPDYNTSSFPQEAPPSYDESCNT